MACSLVAYDEQITFALHRSGILPERELEGLEGEARRQRISEALTDALCAWALQAGAPFLEPRKIPLRVTLRRPRTA